jgi:cobalamin biosynthesis Mg chelatase CobN
MTTDFRALCAELLAALENEGYAHWTVTPDEDELCTRAHAALAQPEPEGPSKAELRQIFDDQSGFINDEQVMWWSDFQPAARAVLARWGNL